MDLTRLMKRRFSARQYSDREVEDDKLQQILEVGRIAPTGANRQPQRILVVKSKEGLDKASRTLSFYDAPVLLIVCGNKDDAWVRPFDKKSLLDIDTSIVTCHMMLKATELGLNTLWLAYFNPKIIAEEFNLPTNFEPINILAVGYSDIASAPPDRHDVQRKSLDEIVFYETF